MPCGSRRATLGGPTLRPRNLIPMPRVLVTDRMWNKWVGPLNHVFEEAGWEIVHSKYPYPLTAEQIREQLPGIDAAMASSQEDYSDAALEGADRLKVISRAGVGYEDIDVEAAARRGIVVTITPQANFETVADATFGLMLALSRRLVLADRNMRFERWDQPTAYDVWSKTLGIVGLGRIGQAVARRARGFEMPILAVEPAPNMDAVEALGVELTDLATLLRESDFVTLHVPAMPETYKLINTERLALMKPTALLINTARGSLVDEDALYEALTTDRLAGAALDVFDPEPPDAESPLVMLENVVVTPHIAGMSEESGGRMGIQAIRNCIDAVEGRLSPDAVVNSVGV